MMADRGGGCRSGVQWGHWDWSTELRKGRAPDEVEQVLSDNSHAVCDYLLGSLMDGIVHAWVHCQ